MQHREQVRAQAEPLELHPDRLVDEVEVGEERDQRPAGHGTLHHRTWRARWRWMASSTRRAGGLRWSDGPRPPGAHPGRRGEPAFRARQVWSWAARGAPGYEEMTNLPAALRARARRRGAVLDADARRRGAVARRNRQVAVPHRRRPAGRGRADALPGWAPLAVPLLPVRLPADVHVLRDGRDEVRPQPHAGEILDQALHFRRIEPVDHAVFMGMGEPMMNLDAVLAAAGACPTSASPTGARRSRRSAGSPARRARREIECRSASPSRCTPPTDGALGADAGQRPLSARRRARGLPRATSSARRRGLRRVRHARRRQRRLEQAASSPRARPRGLQGQPDPVQPDRHVRRLAARGHRRVPRGARRHGVPATVRLTRGRDIAAACGQLATAPRSRVQRAAVSTAG